MRYRRGWNGLTPLNPEPVFHPEAMTLQVFPVDKPSRIVEAEPKRRRSARNTVLWIVTGAALITMFASACAVQAATIAGLAAFAGSGAWVATFFTANRRRWDA